MGKRLVTDLERNLVVAQFLPDAGEEPAHYRRGNPIIAV